MVESDAGADPSATSQQALVVGLVGASHVVNHAYFTLLPPIFGPLREDLGLTDPQLGLALGTLGFVVTALQLPFGHLSDVRGRTLVLGISLSFGAVGVALTALATDFTSLLLAQVVTGVGIAGHHPAHYPLISTVATDGTRGRAYSVHGFTGAVGFAVPFAVIAAGGALGATWRTSVAAIAVGGAVTGAGVLLVLRRSVAGAITDPSSEAPNGTDETNGAPPSAREPIARRIRSALAGATSPAILALTALWFTTSVAGWGIKQYTATLLESGYAVGSGAANATVAGMLTTGAVLIFAGGWLSDRGSPGRVLTWGYVALVAVSLLLAWQGLPAVAGLGLVLVLSATVDASRPARATLADRFSTEATVGKNFGLLTIGISGGAAVAPPVLGFVVAGYGVGAAFVAIAGVGVVALGLTAVVLALGVRRIDD